jgi:hypothetical protein
VSSKNKFGKCARAGCYTLGKYKDAQYMGELFIKVIEDAGVDSCVQIIKDNAPVCKDTGMVVEVKYPQIFWTSCIVIP